MQRIFLIILLLFITGCKPNRQLDQGQNVEQDTNTTLTVFAATSLTDAFIEMGAGFESTHTGVRVIFNFAGSQILRTQIGLGAVADIFAPADHSEIQTLVDENLIQSGTSRWFAANSLVVILPSDNPGKVNSLEDLSRPNLKLVLAAQEVPAGKYARQVLKILNALYGTDYQERVLANLASEEENVRFVLTKVQLGEADFGIVYRSDTVAAPGLKILEIPANMNITVKYPIAALTGSTQPELAKQFISYVLSQAGQSILRKWGFVPTEP